MKCTTLERLVHQKKAALAIFNAAIEAVNPYKIVKETLNKAASDEFRKSSPIYACALGKAGFDMMRAVDDHFLPADQLIKSLVSIPIGQREKTSQYRWKSDVEVFYGAKNNLADQDSMRAAERIYDFVGTLKKNDTLLVLISGGGSALLPLPIDGISLGEKRKVTECLTRKAASIQEINTVRKALSKIKGGGLLRRAHPAQVISFILSDVVGDPIDLIASGPTIVPVRAEPYEAYEILVKYGLFWFG